MNIQLLNTLEDIGWLLQTHLKSHKNIPAFNSFVLSGNEDCPEKIELYKKQNPSINSKPVAIYIADENGNLQITP